MNPQPGDDRSDREAPAATTAVAALGVSLARVGLILRATWSVLVPVLAFLQYDPSGPPAFQLTLILAVVVSWGALFAATVHRHGFDEFGRLAVLADALVYAACLGLADQILPARLVGDNATWLVGGASIAIFVVSWASDTVTTLVVAGLFGLAYVAGIDRSGTGLDGTNYQQILVFLVQAGLAIGILRLMRRGAADADASLVQLERARAELSVERARLRSRRGLERTLHDTVLSTLTAIARGGLADRPQAVRARCARDLARLEEIDGEPGPPLPAKSARSTLGGLRQRIALEVACSPLTVQVRHHPVDGSPDPPVLPDVAVTALVGAVGEALSNVERHAGVREAEIDVWSGPGPVVIVVSDSGCGFDPARVRADATGLRRSVLDRLGAIGGTANVDSVYGGGTVVRLRWDPQAGSAFLPSGDGPADGSSATGAAPTTSAETLSQLSEASTLGLTRVMVVIAIVWHLFCGLLTLASRDVYRSLPLVAGAWVVILAVVLSAAARPRERQTLPIVLASQATVLLAAVTILVAIPADEQLGGANWVMGAIGWPLAVLAIHRPLYEFLLWNAALVAVFLGLVAQAPGAGAPEFGQAAGLVLSALVLQIVGLIAHGIFRRDTARAEEAVRQLTGITVSQQTLNAATRERHRWRREIGASLRPLVRTLADGTADPSDRQIRSRCAIEASRLRAAILVLSDTGEHSGWQRGVVEALTRAALARGSTLEVRITPEFGSVAEEIRGELVNTALATLGMCGAGTAVVTLSGPAPEAGAVASVTVLFTLPADGDAVRRAVTLLLEQVTVALPGAETDVETTGTGGLWLEVRSPAFHLATAATAATAAS